MVKRLFNNDCGAYMPGFFIMDLNMEFSNEFDLNKLEEKEKATLIHEYIHYLQEISTTSGICNFNHVVNMIQLYIRRVYEDKNKVVSIPISIENSGIKNAYLQDELMSLYLGNEKHKKINHVNKVCLEKEVIFNETFNIKEGSENEMSTVNIYYDDKEEPYIFGKTCISESMAYLIEKHIYNSEKREKEFPYNSCELVCEKLYPELSKKYASITAICDMALMHYDSGRLFFEILLNMKKKNYIPNSAKDVYDFLDEEVSHLYKYYNYEYSRACKRIDFLYPNNIDIMISVNKWLKNKIELGYKARLNDSKFITNIMDSNSKEMAYDYFTSLVKKFSLPLVKDNTNCVYGVEKNVNLPLLLVPIALSDLFTKNTGFECSMYVTCKANNEKNLCDACRSNPWVQADKDELCPLALYWYHFTLSGKSLKYRDN